jgi:two-component system OmpR family sensor kinase
LAGVGVLVVRRGLRPLETIVATAGAITRGDRGQRIPLASGDTEVGRVAAALNQMLDETESSFAAQQDSEDRLRQFIADASHELRTPLATVRSYAELLRTGAASSPEDQTLAVNRIESESARMSELVEDLLLLARLDMGRPLRSEPVELAALVRDAVEDENAVDPSRQRTLVITGDTWVSGDANRLRQVLVNLFTNARVHTPAGTPVEIALEGPFDGEVAGTPVVGTPVVGHEDGVVRITVTDHGAGLSEEQAGRVFERFYRADTARTHRSGCGSGVGLGLSIVAAIVTAHQGTVHVDGGAGQGARFTVVLPAGVTTNRRSTP